MLEIFLVSVAMLGAAALGFMVGFGTGVLSQKAVQKDIDAASK